MTPERARELLAGVPGVTIVAGAAPVTAQVPADHWQAAARVTKDTLGCTFFSFLTAIDWKAEGIEIVAWMDDLDTRLQVMLRTKLGAAKACPSLVPIYRGANWMERECYDMFGVAFTGHPDLRRILLADDWEGHPLLKSYAIDTPHPPYR